jgi:cation transport regulator ChaB
MPVKKKSDLPSTLQRSSEKAQRTYGKTLNAAEEEYGSGERAGRTAIASLKHSFEKVGDHWEEKDHKGPSDAQAAKGGKAARDSQQSTAGGVDTTRTKADLMEQAKEMDVPGRSKMDKGELVKALQKANDRATAKARRDAS